MPLELFLSFLTLLFVLVVGPPAVLLAANLLGLPIPLNFRTWLGALILIVFLN